LTRSTIPCACHTKAHPNLKKWSENGVLCTFRLRNPQRRALFEHLNFQKGSDTEAFCAFWLRNVLRATTPCIFSTAQLPKWSETLKFLPFWLPNVLRAATACTLSSSQLPKVVRTCDVFSILTWKCASRHNGVQFFISHLALASLLFDPLFSDSSHFCFWKFDFYHSFDYVSTIM
jgi:hypothetical protein